MSTGNLSGTTIGRYKLTRLLGVGGMGSVYLAIQTGLSRQVAVKVLNANISQDPLQQARFDREAKTAASLENLHIAPIMDYGSEDGVWYVVMQHLSGGTLTQRFANQDKYRSPIPSIKESIDVIQQIASGLDYAHSKGVIHRDIKPSNILFDLQGNAFLADFGIAHLQSSETQLTSTGTLIGTPAYMPPEQWRGEKNLTQATDQYAFAAMVYQLLSGRLPFEADTSHAMMYKHLNQPPEPIHNIRKELHGATADVLDHALSKEPTERYDSVGAFAKALSESVDKGVASEPTGFFTTLIETTTYSVGAKKNTVPHSPVPNTQSQISIAVGGRRGGTILGIALLLFVIAGVLLITQGSAIIAANNATATLTNLPTLSDEQVQATIDISVNLTSTAFDLTQYAVASVTQKAENTQAAQLILDTTATAESWTHTPTPSFTSTSTLTPTYTPTSTSTHTPTATATYTDTPTETATATATDTVTLSATSTFTATPTATYTATQTLTLSPSNTPTQTLTRTPRATSTPELITCPGTAQSRLIVNAMAEVIPGPSNNVRKKPSVDSKKLFQIPGGRQFLVLEGPICEDGYAWWKVNYSGDIGWTAEGAIDEYWLQPLGGETEVLQQARVFVQDEGLKLRNSPSAGSFVVQNMPSDTIVDVLGGPRSAEGYVWWYLETDEGNTGWAVEGAEGIQTLIFLP